MFFTDLKLSELTHRTVLFDTLVKNSHLRSNTKIYFKKHNQFNKRYHKMQDATFLANKKHLKHYNDSHLCIYTLSVIKAYIIFIC